MASKSLIHGNNFNERKTLLLFKAWSDAAGSSAGGGGIANPHQEFFALVDPEFGDYGFRNMLGRVVRTLSWDSLWLGRGL